MSSTAFKRPSIAFTVKSKKHLPKPGKLHGFIGGLVFVYLAYTISPCGLYVLDMDDQEAPVAKE